LLTASGAYFEFVPTEEADRPVPTRHDVANIEPGVCYDLAVTSAAGLWGCRVGLSVRFERRDPPLFRLVAAQRPAPQARQDAAGVTPLQAPHRQTGGMAATPPESSGHISWSARADRG